MKVNLSTDKHIFIVIMAIFICFAGASDAFAQNPDTLQVITNSGYPGDTVSTFINLANHTDSIGGFVLNIAYNPGSVEVADVLPTSMIDVWDVFAYDFPNDGILHVVAFDMHNDSPIPIGSGYIVELRFVIGQDAPRNNPIVFEVIDSVNDNALSTWDGSAMLYPVLINGYVINNDTPVNDPPYFTQIPSTPQYVNPGDQLQFLVAASDPDGDLISLSANNLPPNSFFPTIEDYGQVQSTFTFNPVVGQGPDTFYVEFVVDDASNLPVTQVVTIYLSGSGGNQPPVIYPIGSQQIAEGSHLEFEVSAYDPEGDIITLAASNVPPNANFPVAQGDSVVSSTFTFDPDFTQGPDTIFVTFSASDDYNNVTNMPVQIIVLDTPNDFLEIGEAQGALPGAVDRNLTINLRNAKPIYGLQFDLIYNPEILDIFSVTPDSARTYDLAFFSELLEPGRYRIMIFSMGLDSIKTGSGRIADFNLDVDVNAIVGLSEVSIDSATSVQDSIGSSKDIISFPGGFHIDVLGDANLDEIVSVGDCIAIIAHLLNWIELDIRSADAADFNRDGDVRIADLMEIVNFILGRTVSSPPPLASAGNVEIIRDDIYPGFNGEVPIWLTLDTEASAVQFTIEYDPSVMVINGLSAGSMVSNFDFRFNDTGSEIKAVIYRLDLSKFGPTLGELVNLDIECLDNANDPAHALRLTDFEIVNIDAHALNVDILGELPTQFILHQNYPNPFNATTLISFDMPVGSDMKLDIYNILGQHVNELYNGYLDAGLHHVVWDGADSNGESVTSGIYFYRFQTESFDKTKKMMLVK